MAKSMAMQLSHVLAIGRLCSWSLNQLAYATRERDSMLLLMPQIFAPSSARPDCSSWKTAETIAL
jgi:hypothetical protein